MLIVFSWFYLGAILSTLYAAVYQSGSNEASFPQTKRVFCKVLGLYLAPREEQGQGVTLLCFLLSYTQNILVLVRHENWNMPLAERAYPRTAGYAYGLPPGYPMVRK